MSIYIKIIGEKKVIASLILHTCHNVFPTFQLHGFSENEFFKIFLGFFPLMAQSHVLALAAIVQKTEQSELVEQTHLIESKLQNFFI